MMALLLVVNFAAVEDGTNVITLTTGEEHGMIVGAGYDHVFALADRPLVVGADLTLSGGDFDPRDFRLRTGAQLPIVDGRWKVIGGLTALARGTNNPVATMVDVGADIELLAGRYERRWYAAAELGFDWALATHITNSDQYRMLAYPDARDGWYRNTGGLFRAGLQGGISFGDNDVVLRAGVLRDDAGDAPTMPFYATLAYARRW